MFGAPVKIHSYAEKGTIIFRGIVTKIGDSAFENCTKLSSITLPAGPKTIGIKAFNGCSSLEGIEIRSGVTHIFESAFYDCLSLSHVTLPEGLEAIWTLAFAYCAQLSAISIPSTVSEIFDWAFYDCGRNSKSFEVVFSSVTPPILGLESLPDYVSIKVPSAAVEKYKSAPGLTEYADKIEGY